MPTSTDTRTRPDVAPCPVCGGFSLTSEGELSTLLAVCDVLAVGALRTVGKYLVRAERSRYRAMGTRPWHVAHTLFPPAPADEGVVDKALRDAWDVVPALLAVHGTCEVTPVQVTAVLDSYVHDLVVTGTEHDLGELAYRLQSRLGLPVYLKVRVPCDG